MNYQGSSLSPGPVYTEEVPYDIYSNPYPGFTWLNPSMVVDDSTPDIDGSDWSPESSPEPYTPSQFDAPAIEQSPDACGSFQVLDSISLSLSCLYRYPTFNFDSDVSIDRFLSHAARPLDVVDVSVPASTASQSDAVFENSDIVLGPETAVMPTQEDDEDEALVRMSIKSLDVGEEPIFDLPPGWTEAFVSLEPTDVTVPPSSLPRAKRAKTSIMMLPKLKSLWKRAASKFVSRPA
jgi:hypothetical protein